jgi:UDP-N-acetylmuramoylalanine--D-glutamate ligase
MELRGKTALVVGMKRSGIAAVELLTFEGANVRATDLKPLDELPEARQVLERLRIPFAVQSPGVFEDAELIVISPDVPAGLAPLDAARRRGAKVIGEIELAAPFLKGRNIGVTGSNGKTTTTSLIGHILREARVPVQVGGNIGTPAAEMIANSRLDGWNVLELSSFQLETISEFRAHIALGLNVTQNHLDRHITFENYASAKARLFETQHAGDEAILNADDPVCVKYANLTKGTVNWFSSSREVTAGAGMHGDWLVLDGAALMRADEIPIRGRHNAQNVLAASIAAARAGVGCQAIAAAVRTFHAVEHRLEFVRELGSVDFYNDSKATSVDAALKALDAFPGGLWVILGGKDKGLDYSPLRAPLAQKAHAALLIGAAASKIAAQLDGAIPLVQAGTLDAAITHAFRHAAPGDTVLLAPACSSFDQFRSFEHRGETFKQLVNKLQPEK